MRLVTHLLIVGVGIFLARTALAEPYSSCFPSPSCETVQGPADTADAPTTCRKGETYIKLTAGSGNCATGVNNALCLCTADNTWTAVGSAGVGTATLSSNSLLANQTAFATTGIIFEGTTADANETLLTVTDPTADRTLTLPDVTGSVVVQGSTDSLSSNALGAAGIEGIKTTNGGLMFEGATADANEGYLTVTDPTADRTWTLPDVTGTIVTTGDTASVTATMVANITRSIPLPIGSWVPCAGQGIWTTDGVDNKPNLTVNPTGVLGITYDATGGSVDTGTICNSFVVPADYISGGAFKARLVEGSATVTQVETFSCAISVDGATLGAANAGNIANQTAVQTVTSTPAGTWAAGASIQVACSQGNATADDAVTFLAIEGQYTASE